MRLAEERRKRDDYNRQVLKNSVEIEADERFASWSRSRAGARAEDERKRLWEAATQSRGWQAGRRPA